MIAKRFAMVALAMLPAPMLLNSCFSAPRHSANVERFLKDARNRASTGDRVTPVNLQGLRYTLGTLPNSRNKEPRANEDSILVSDVDSGIRDAVQIVVTPRVGLTLPATGEASPEFLERLEKDTEKALRRNRYVSVEHGRLPDPGEADITPRATPGPEESIRVLEHKAGGGEPRLLYSTYGSEKDRQFVMDLVGRLRPELEGDRIHSTMDAGSDYLEIQVNSGGYTWTLNSWHPLYEGDGANSGMIATNYGLEPLNGRNRAEVLAQQPGDYLAFRRLFDELLTAMKQRRR